MARPRQFLLLLSLLVSPVLFAASADLSVDIAVVGTPVNELTTELTLDVRNHGPDAATSIVVLWSHRNLPPMESRDSRCVATANGGVRCEVASLAANESVQFRAAQFLRGNAQATQHTDASVTAATPDPNTANNQRTLDYVPATPPADVVGDIGTFAPFRNDATIVLPYAIRNQNPDWPATLIAKIDIPRAIEVVSTNAPCTALSGEGVTLECTLANVPPSTTFHLEVLVRFPEAAGRVATTLDVFWLGYPDVVLHRTHEQIFPRYFRVTTSVDGGPGSLRALIDDANVRCRDRVPCVLRFAIAEAVPVEGWFTLRLVTALPVLTAPIVTLDATMQFLTSGDTNPAGPEVFLDGTLLASGHGLEVRDVESFAVHGLAIGNFRANGIHATASTRQLAFNITKNYIGVDPTGHRPMPNVRGVVVENGYGVLAENVISGNLRSGAFFLNAGSILVQANRIGVPSTGEDHLPNYASGVYVGSTSGGIFSRIEFTRNVIAHNRDFGIALGPNVTANVMANRIFGHLHGAVDAGLDGPTLAFAPVIERVYRDGGDTVIEGTVPPQVIGPISVSYGVLLYANASVDAAGFAEAEQLIGSAKPDANGRFTHRFSGDLGGLYIDAMTVRTTNYHGEYQANDTSELSRAVRVE